MDVRHTKHGFPNQEDLREKLRKEEEARKAEDERQRTQHEAAEKRLADRLNDIVSDVLQDFALSFGLRNATAQLQRFPADADEEFGSLGWSLVDDGDLPYHLHIYRVTIQLNWYFTQGEGYGGKLDALIVDAPGKQCIVNSGTNSIRIAEILAEATGIPTVYPAKGRNSLPKTFGLPKQEVTPTKPRWKRLLRL